MANTVDILNESTATGLSVRGNCWRARAIALAQLDSCAYWIQHREERAARRAAKRT